MKLQWTFKMIISDINMHMNKNLQVQLDGIVKSGPLKFKDFWNKLV